MGMEKKKIKGNPPVKRAVKKPTRGKALFARSGGKKLDELLGGGFPIKSNILIQAPAFIGKDLLMSQFVSEGIKTGIPSVIVTTNSTTSQIRRKIYGIHPQIQEKEKKGLISYIDCYSKTAGLLGKNPFAIYIDGVGDMDQILGTIEKFQSGYKEKYFYQRMIFDSLSTVMRNHGLNPTMDFLHSLKAKNSSYNGVSLLDLSSGIHRPDEINALESVVDGTVLMKEEKGKYLMSIRGLNNVKSKDWMEYKFDDSGIDIKGVYSYTYIR